MKFKDMADWRRFISPPKMIPKIVALFRQMAPASTFRDKDGAEFSVSFQIKIFSQNCESEDTQSTNSRLNNKDRFPSRVTR
jgi:hypothetical protein